MALYSRWSAIFGGFCFYYSLKTLNQPFSLTVAFQVHILDNFLLDGDNVFYRIELVLFNEVYKHCNQTGLISDKYWWAPRSVRKCSCLYILFGQAQTSEYKCMNVYLK